MEFDRPVYIASCSVSGGILYCRMDTGYQLIPEQLAPLDRPMYLAKDGPGVWAVLRAPAGYGGKSALAHCALRPDGTLGEGELLGSTRGEVACHLWARDGEVFCVNYISGSVFYFPQTLVQHNGCGSNPVRQQSAHPHFIGVDPISGLLCVADLGLDTIFFYSHQLEVTATLQVPAGQGARHLAFSPDGSYLYCLNELGSTISVFAREGAGWRATGIWPTLPKGYRGDSTAAALRVSQDGRFIYASNRGHNSIAWFSIQQDRLEPAGIQACEGSWPRDINLYGDTLLCANEHSGSVTVFHLEQGVPIFTGQFLGVEAPVCLI